jgi:hypothetical protein
VPALDFHVPVLMSSVVCHRPSESSDGALRVVTTKECARETVLYVLIPP